jgi:subtilisin family serine protease
MRRIAIILCAAVAASSAGVVPVAAAPPAAAWQVNTKAPGGRWVTLVTGDRVYLDGDRVAIEAAAGRERVGFSQYAREGHQYVVPNDALRLVSSGRVDGRLFDVTGLVAAGYDDSAVAEVPAIVTGASPQATRVTRALSSVRGSAVRVDKRRAATFWADVTANKVGKLWLDGRRTISLDRSVPQIGAPDAWAAGYDGSGVTVAVLDTGADATHPDLAGRITEQRDFTGTGDLRDTVGHGTHVAATIAGTNARYRGVAPGATLLIGKVCPTRQCDESAILAGMEWAAPRADIVNLSLGGPDTGDADPLKVALNALTASTGTLFVVAAGNNGAEGGVSSPATADAALAVGAVDRQENLASFSNRGPRADGAIKPDLTAPGVDIVAARSKDSGYPESSPGYTQLSGTSMATPHVAGAAALLAQQHPAWRAGELKAQLMASARPNPALTPNQQGAGRVDLTRAVRQAVLAAPASLALGTQAYPASDDAPVVRTVTYRNDGAAAVTLTLTAPATGPDGAAAPAGMFAVSPERLTVPAGGTASATLTADTRVTSPTGAFQGAVVASSADGTISARVPLTIAKEHESRRLTVTVLDRTGAPATDYALHIVGVDFQVFKVPYSATGTTTTSLRVGRYDLQATVVTPEPGGGSSTLLVRPAFTVASGGDAQVVLDARQGTSASVTVRREGAASRLAALGYHRVLPSGYSLPYRVVGATFDKLYAASLGDPLPADAGRLTSEVRTFWARSNADGTFDDSPYEYDLVWYKRGGLFRDFRHVVRDSELAKVTHRFHAVTPDARTAIMHNWGFPAEGGSALSGPIPFTIPGERVSYHSADGVSWDSRLDQRGPGYGTQFWTAPVTWKAGKRYTVEWQKGPAAPIFNDDLVFFTRTGNVMAFNVPPFGDQAGHSGYSTLDTGKMAFYRDGVLLASIPTYFYDAGGAVPATESTYRLEYAVTRGADGSFDNATAISGAWTFRSAETPADRKTALPLASVAFRPALDLENSAPGGRPYAVPVTIERQPGAAPSALRKTRVDVSYDEGATWHRVTLLPTGRASWLAMLHHPKQGSVSLRATAEYADGATVDYTVTRAYSLR